MSAHCPPVEQLERLLDDCLETIEDSKLARHVETCAACQARLEHILASNSPSSLLIQSSSEGADVLLSRLKKRGQQGDETVHRSSHPLAPTGNEGAALPDVPGYEILSEIGRGGMGVIYKARHLRLGRVVALKMILAGVHARSEDLRRFRIEASAVARLAHPGIVGVYDVGEHEGLPFISLEFVEGGSLKQLLGGVPQPPRQSARLVEQLARAVQHAHDAGIVHRDLKPANVLLKKADFTAENAENAEKEKRRAEAKTGETKREEPEPSPSSLSVSSSAFSAFSAVNLLPKITDFGLAKLLTEGPADGPTQSGAVVGTPGYMAPEQAAGHQHQVGPAVDVYALGAILYECLTGRPPFQAPTTLETLLQVMHDEPVSISRLQPHVPRDLATIAMRCLEKQPVKRYASARDLADDLARFLSGRPILARRVGPLERGWRWCKRNPVVASLASSLLVALVLGIVGVSWKWWEAEQRRGQAEASAEAEKLARQDESAQRAKAERNLGYARKGNEVLASVFTGLDPKANYQTVADLRNALRDNLRKAVTELEGSAIGDPLEVAAMQDKLGRSLWGLGEAPLAVEVFRKALDAYKAKLGPDHPDTLLSMNNLAAAYQASGQLARAVPLFEETLQQRKARLGPDHPETLESMNNLAGAYKANGQLARAMPLFEETLQKRKARLGPDHPDTLISMGNLGKVYVEAKKGEKAAATLVAFVDGSRKQAPKDSPRFAGLLAQVSLDLIGCGQHAAAEPLLRECLAIREKTQPDNWLTFNTQSMLGRALLGQKKYADAEPLLLAGYEGMKQRQKTIPPAGMIRLPEAARRLVQLYEATDKKDEAARWRMEEQRYSRAARKPSS